MMRLRYAASGVPAGRAAPPRLNPSPLERLRRYALGGQPVLHPVFTGAKLALVRAGSILKADYLITTPGQRTNREETTMAINADAIAVHDGFHAHLIGGIERNSSTCFFSYMR